MIYTTLNQFLKRNFLAINNRDKSSTLPIIIKKIREYLVKKCKFWKSKSGKPYAEELTVFIKVNTANLNEYSNWILNNDNKMVKEKREITKINIVKKYLFISFESKLIFENTSLFMNTFFGLLKERIWLIEYLVKEYIFKNLKPELVEKKDPPIITSKIYIKFKLVWLISSEIPIFEILLTRDKKLNMKLAS